MFFSMNAAQYISNTVTRNVRNGFLNFGSVSVLKKTAGSVLFRFGFVTTTDIYYMEGRFGRFIDFKPYHSAHWSPLI